MAKIYLTPNGFLVAPAFVETGSDIHFETNGTVNAKTMTEVATSNGMKMTTGFDLQVYEFVEADTSAIKNITSSGNSITITYNDNSTQAIARASAAKGGSDFVNSNKTSIQYAVDESTHTVTVELSNLSPRAQRAMDRGDLSVALDLRLPRTNNATSTGRHRTKIQYHRYWRVSEDFSVMTSNYTANKGSGVYTYKLKYNPDVLNMSLSRFESVIWLIENNGGDIPEYWYSWFRPILYDNHNCRFFEPCQNTFYFETKNTL